MEEFIKTINVFDYKRFRDRVVKECNISRTSWSRWCAGAVITEKYKPIIDKIALELFGCSIFEKEAINENH